MTELVSVSAASRPRGPFFTRLNESEDALNATLANCRDRVGRIAQLIADMASVTGAIPQDESRLLLLSITDATFALQSAATAEYRGAFASLRSCTELGVAAIYYSVRELELRLWLAGRRQFVWGAALSSDSCGPFANEFVAEYGHEALFTLVPEYRAAITDSYSICSDIVHGRRHVHPELPDKVSFSVAALDFWAECAEDALTALLFLILVRFGRELAGNEKVGDIFLSVLGHRVEVREVITQWRAEDTKK